jgi:hypothetical protein
VVRKSGKEEIRILPRRFLTGRPTRCLQVSIFCVWRALRCNAATGCSHERKIFDSGRNWSSILLPSAHSTAGHAFTRSNQNSMVTVTSKLASDSLSR